MSNNRKLFLDRDGIVRIVELDDNFAKSELECSVYNARYNEGIGFYLERVCKKFDVPNKIYGNIEKKANKIINSYTTEKTKNTGVILEGTKGAGKTLLSNIIANMSIDIGNPVIRVNQAFYGDDFIKFINKIGDCTLIFDEFEKVYAAKKEENTQNKLLKLFDDNSDSNSRFLQIVITNNIHKLSDFLINRPSRFMYRLEYRKLDSDIVEEVCKDMEIDNESTEFIKNYSGTVRTFSYDILMSIIREYKKYSDTETIEEIINDMNIENIENTVKLTIGKIFIDNEEYKPIRNGIDFNELKTIGDLLSIVNRNKSKLIDKYKNFIDYNIYIQEVEYEDSNMKIVKLDDALPRIKVKLIKEVVTDDIMGYSKYLV